MRSPRHLRSLLIPPLAGVACSLALGTAASAGSSPYQPDARIRPVAPDAGAEIGDDVYLDVRFQFASEAIEADEKAKFSVRLQNDGTVPDSFRVRGFVFVPGSDRPTEKSAQTAGGFKVRYRRHGNDVTDRVAAGLLQYRDVAPGEVTDPLKVVVRPVAEEPVPENGPVPAAFVGARINVAVQVTSVNEPVMEDLVGAEVVLVDTER